MSGVREPVVKVQEAAELRGMTEDECMASLRGARFYRVNGELVVNRADLEAALKRGIVPKVAGSTERRTDAAARFLGIDASISSENQTEPATPEPIPDPLALAPDPAVEARTADAAKALGIDLAPATSSTIKPEQGRKSGAPVTVTADDDTSYRLGRPRRWGQT